MRSVNHPYCSKHLAGAYSPHAMTRIIQWSSAYILDCFAILAIEVEELQSHERKKTKASINFFIVKETKIVFHPQTLCLRFRPDISISWDVNDIYRWIMDHSPKFDTFRGSKRYLSLLQNDMCGRKWKEESCAHMRFLVRHDEVVIVRFSTTRWLVVALSSVIVFIQHLYPLALKF